MKPKPKIVSGIRPTGMLHLGNYLGALRQFVELQNADESCLFFIADLHALTTLQKPAEIDANTIHVARMYLACGLDPDQSLIYRQSDIPEIPYLATLLAMITPDALLRRCTTYKDKVSKQEVPTLGLLSYPVLMAADILIVKAEVVPVGEDQLQHLEIARDIAGKFNNSFGEVFVLPRAREMQAIRVPGLDGSGKMGKSEGNTIGILDSPAEIRGKIARAKTDSGLVAGTMSEAIQNLYRLLELCSSPNTLAKFRDMHASGKEKFYGELKAELAEDVIRMLAPLRERYETSECSAGRALAVLNEGKERLRPIAGKTLREALARFGVHSEASLIAAARLLP